MSFSVPNSPDSCSLKEPPASCSLALCLDKTEALFSSSANLLVLFLGSLASAAACFALAFLSFRSAKNFSALSLPTDSLNSCKDFPSLIPSSVSNVVPVPANLPDGALRFPTAAFAAGCCLAAALARSFSLASSIFA